MTTPPGETTVRSGRIRIAAATVPGAVHLRRGRPNQDAVGWLPASGEGERLVMAVSDGHGGAASPRSHLGSRLAVDVTTQLLWKLPRPLTEQTLRDAVTEIASAWRHEVQEHLDRHPLSGAEIEQGALEPATDVPARLREHPILAYGATLVFAVVDGDQVGLGQLGDGDVLLVSGPDDTHRPLPPDTRLMGHTTTSLCDDDPLGNTRLAVLPLSSRLVVLSTDGYANSFADDASFLKVGTDLLAAVETAGITHVRQSLPTWLAETSLHGAGDDISVAVAMTALSRAPAQPSPTPGAARPEARPVQVRPVRPAETPTMPIPHRGNITVPLLEPSASPIVRSPAAQSAPKDASPLGGPPPPHRPPGKNDVSARPDPLSPSRLAGRKAVAIGLAGLAVVLGLTIGGYVLLGHRGNLDHRGNEEPPPAQVPSPVPTRSTSPSPSVAVSWVVSDDGRTIQRRTGSTVTGLPLPSPVRKLVQVPDGALLLLTNRQVGLLPEDGALSVDGWPTEDASDLACEETRCYLLDGSGNRVRTIDPRTGKVSALPFSKGPTPFGPPPGTRPPTPDGEASKQGSGSVTVRMPHTGAVISSWHRSTGSGAPKINFQPPLPDTGSTAASHQ